ncbi:MAG: GNAT family N-acetyltransferase [Pirellulales bacterium]
MSVTYFKRFRMEIDLVRLAAPRVEPPAGYSLLPWSPDLLAAHAEVKHASFRDEIDAFVFPCLGNFSGCLRLMDEICRKARFLADATWLAAFRHPNGERENCGTISAVLDASNHGAIQNIGVTPAHRGCGIGTALLLQTLAGFQRGGLRRAYLEVTAQNVDAVRLYQRIGFRRTRTSYKAVESVASFV